MPNLVETTKGRTKYRGIPMEVFVNSNTKKIAAVISIPNPTNPAKPYRISGSSNLMNGDTYNEQFGIILAKKRAYRNMQKMMVRTYEKIKNDVDKKLSRAKFELTLTDRKINHQLQYKYPDYQPRPELSKEEKKVIRKAKKEKNKKNK
jgi:hypothetical protein